MRVHTMYDYARCKKTDCAACRAYVESLKAVIASPEPAMSKPESKRYQILGVRKVLDTHPAPDWPNGREIANASSTAEALLICNALNQHQAGSISISREVAEYAVLCMRKEDKSAKRYCETVFKDPKGWGYVEFKDNLTAEISTALEEKEIERGPDEQIADTEEVISLKLFDAKKLAYRCGQTGISCVALEAAIEQINSKK